MDPAIPKRSTSSTVPTQARLSRRTLLKGMALSAGVLATTALAGCTVAPVAPAAGGESSAQESGAQADEVIVLWHDLGASDAQVWDRVCASYNEENAGSGIVLDYQQIPGDELRTKVMASIATGTPPDIGFRTMNDVARWQAAGALVPLNDLMATVALDLDDFLPQYIEWCTIDGSLYSVDLDILPHGTYINAAHARDAGLDVENPPLDSASLIEWAKAMTVVENGVITRSGFINSGSGIQPGITFGIIAMQYGAQPLNADRTQVTLLETDAPVKAAQWVLDTFDTHQISSRDVADRYGAFGQQVGSILWTGPWTLSGYVATEGLDFITAPTAQIGDTLLTEAREYGLALFTAEGRSDEHILAGAKVIKWFSDNSMVWVTEGRGAPPRKSILEDPAYQSSGIDWNLRKPFADAVAYSFFDYLNMVDGESFAFYAGGTSPVPKSMDPVWAGDISIEEGLENLAAEWQALLDNPTG